MSFLISLLCRPTSRGLVAGGIAWAACGPRVGRRFHSYEVIKHRGDEEVCQDRKGKSGCDHKGH